MATPRHASVAPLDAPDTPDQSPARPRARFLRAMLLSAAPIPPTPSITAQIRNSFWAGISARNSPWATPRHASVAPGDSPGQPRPCFHLVQRPLWPCQALIYSPSAQRCPGGGPRRTGSYNPSPNSSPLFGSVHLAQWLIRQDPPQESPADRLKPTDKAALLREELQRGEGSRRHEVLGVGAPAPARGTARLRAPGPWGGRWHRSRRGVGRSSRAGGSSGPCKGKVTMSAAACPSRRSAPTPHACSLPRSSHSRSLPGTVSPAHHSAPTSWTLSVTLVGLRGGCSPRVEQPLPCPRASPQASCAPSRLRCHLRHLPADATRGPSSAGGALAAAHHGRWAAPGPPRMSAFQHGSVQAAPSPGRTPRGGGRPRHAAWPGGYSAVLAASGVLQSRGFPAKALAPAG